MKYILRFIAADTSVKEAIARIVIKDSGFAIHRLVTDIPGTKKKFIQISEKIWWPKERTFDQNVQALKRVIEEEPRLEIAFKS